MYNLLLSTAIVLINFKLCIGEKCFEKNISEEMKKFIGSQMLKCKNSSSINRNEFCSTKPFYDTSFTKVRILISKNIFFKNSKHLIRSLDLDQTFL